MARYVTIPEQITLLDPTTDEPAMTPDGPKLVSFAETARLLVLDQRIQEKFDTFTLNDLRKKLTRGKPGDVVEIRDEEHGMLTDCCKQPKTVAPALRFSAESHFRAIVDAPTVKPEGVP